MHRFVMVTDILQLICLFFMALIKIEILEITTTLKTRNTFKYYVTYSKKWIMIFQIKDV